MRDNHYPFFIEPSGEVKPGNFTPLVLGNVNEKTLGELWQNMLTSPVFHQVKDPKYRTGYCKSCPHADDCAGCRSRIFVLTKDWFASDPVCPLKPK